MSKRSNDRDSDAKRELGREMYLTFNLFLDSNLSYKECMEAILQDGDNIKYIENQTPELCMIAVQTDGWAIEHVQNQTPELCMAAVQCQAIAIEYVLNQTPELCMAAVKLDYDAFQYIRNKTSVLAFVAQQTRARLNCENFAEMVDAISTRLPRDASRLVMEFTMAIPFTMK